MANEDVLGSYFPQDEVEAARKYVEIFHGRMLVSDQLGRGNRVLLGAYMLSNKTDSSEVGKTELKELLTSQLGVNATEVTKGLSEIKQQGFVSDSGEKVGLTFKGLKTIKGLLKVELKGPSEVVLEQASKGEIPMIGTPANLRDGITKLLSSEWGKDPRTLGELQNALEINALFYPLGTMSAELTRMTKGALIGRKKTPRGYAYVLSKRAQ